MDALDWRAGDSTAGHRPDFGEQRAGIPIDRPAAPQPKLSGDNDGDDLVAVAEANQLPIEVPRRRKLRDVDVNNEQVGRFANRDLAGDGFQADGVGSAARGVIEPGPAAASGEIADTDPERDALQGLGSLDHAERIAACAVSTDTEPDTEFGHHLCRRHRVTLPGRSD